MIGKSITAKHLFKRLFFSLVVLLLYSFCFLNQDFILIACACIKTVINRKMPTQNSNSHFTPEGDYDQLFRFLLSSLAHPQYTLRLS